MELDCPKLSHITGFSSLNTIISISTTPPTTTTMIENVYFHQVYAINFHPACLFFGRFIAGFGDAFFVVIMARVNIIRNHKGSLKTLS